MAKRIERKSQTVEKNDETDPLLEFANQIFRTKKERHLARIYLEAARESYTYKCRLEHHKTILREALKALEDYGGALDKDNVRELLETIYRAM